MPDWLVNAIGVLAGVIGTLCWMPQLIKTLRTRETRDLSLGSNLLLLVTILLWLIYALNIGAWPMVASNVIATAIIGTIIICKLRYG
ncbi:MAG: PQ-loop domain-containing transporter [Paracoccaceae bacterium]